MNDEKQRLERLIALQRDHKLSPSEQEELDELLLRNPDARYRFIDHLFLEQDLREELESYSSIGEQERPRKGLFIFRPSFISSLAAIIAVVFTINYFAIPRFPTDATENKWRIVDHPSIKDSVAIVKRSSNAEWTNLNSDSSHRQKMGNVIYAGALELEKGFVQLDLYNGVSIVVEGPAKLEIESPDLIRLQQGKIRANVPPPARGFRIIANEFNVVDLGTEFAVSVDEHGKGELHVIDGEVEMSSGLINPSSSRIMTTGNGAILYEDGSHTPISANERLFADTNSILTENGARYTKWRQHFEQLSANPDTIAIYDFQNLLGNHVPNKAVHGPADSDGVVVGCLPGQGRWNKNAALEFNTASDRVRVSIDGEYNQLTMSTWVYVDSLSLVSLPFIQSESDQAKHLIWDLRSRPDQNGMTSFFAETTKQGKDREARARYYSSGPHLDSDHIGQWVHFAVTFNTETSEVVHYFNGQVIDRNSIENPRSVGIGIADIGNWPYRDWAVGTIWEVRHLIGKIDEFIVSRRAFEPDEIANIYELGRP